jgi:hypothetical protein
MIEKHLLVADRVRRPPREGFSWVDRRFLRDFASRLSGDAVFLYFLLAAVSDKHGLSFYGDATIAVRLRMREEAVVAARDDLVTGQGPQSTPRTRGMGHLRCSAPKGIPESVRPEKACESRGRPLIQNFAFDCQHTCVSFRITITSGRRGDGSG